MKSRLAAAAAAVSLTAALAGCNFITPQATQYEYDAADGISGTTGLVEIRNAVLVAEGELSSLVVTFVNDGPATSLSVTVGTETQDVDLDDGLTAYGFAEQQLVFTSPLEAGSLEDVVFVADAADRTALPVPVFSTDTAGWASYGPVEPEEQPDEVTPAPTEGANTEPSLTPQPTPEPSSP